MSTKKIPTSVSLDQEIIDWVDELRRKQGRSRSAMIERLLWRVYWMKSTEKTVEVGDEEAL